jgi:hypothetical protein
MSADEILDELPRLTPDEIQPSPEFHTAIEQGLHSLETEPIVSLEELDEKIAKWAGRSS